MKIFERNLFSNLDLTPETKQLILDVHYKGTAFLMKHLSRLDEVINIVSRMEGGNQSQQSFSAQFDLIMASFSQKYFSGMQALGISMPLEKAKVRALVENGEIGEAYKRTCQLAKLTSHVYTRSALRGNLRQLLYTIKQSEKGFDVQRGMKTMKIIRLFVTRNIIEGFEPNAAFYYIFDGCVEKLLPKHKEFASLSTECQRINQNRKKGVDDLVAVFNLIDRLGNKS